MRNLSISFRIVSAPLRPRTASVISSTASPFSIRSHHHYTKPFLPISKQKLLKAGPITAILGSFFSTSSKAESDKMSYPDKRSEEEWRAVLSPGIFTPSHPIPSHPIISSSYLSPLQTHGPKLTLLSNRTIPHPPRKRHRTTVHRGI